MRVMMYCFIPSSDAERCRYGLPLRFDRQIFEWRGVGKAGDPVETRLPASRANAVQEAELPDRRVDRFLVNETLHLLEHRGSLLMVELVRLLRVERVDVGIAAIGEGAVLDHKGGEPGRGVAEGAARRLDDALAVFLVGIAGVETGALDRLQLGADADLAEIVDRDLGHVRVGAVAIEQAGIEAAGKAGL